MEAIKEILKDVQSISRKNLTKIKQVKKTPLVQLIRASDVNGNIYIGINNNSFYYIKHNLIFKID